MAEGDPAKLDVLIQDRIADIPNSLTEYEATFERRDLIEAVSNALVGTNASPERADQESKDLIDRKAIVPLGTSRNGAVYSTPEMIAFEARLVETAAELANAHVTARNTNLVRRRCIDAGLSKNKRRYRWPPHRVLVRCQNLDRPEPVRQNRSKSWPER
jgi:hypothetical protein